MNAPGFPPGMGPPPGAVPVQDPNAPDPNSHEGMAAEIIRLFNQSNLQIPVAAAERFVEINQWLQAIAEGALTVTETPKQ